MILFRVASKKFCLSDNIVSIVKLLLIIFFLFNISLYSVFIFKSFNSIGLRWNIWNSINLNLLVSSFTWWIRNITHSMRSHKVLIALSTSMIFTLNRRSSTSCRIVLAPLLTIMVILLLLSLIILMSILGHFHRFINMLWLT